MTSEDTVEEYKPDPQDIQTATKLLATLFEEQDTVLFRPIETWTEGGRKRSQVDYRNTCYRKAAPKLVALTVWTLMNEADSKRLNLFFGVCPRVDGQGKFDLAWQIRTVRALWVDIDHVTVEEARARIASAGLPEPSIIVNSGNGVHVYWLLEEPYLIDDAGDPPAAETEWTDLGDGRRKPRKYILEDGERVYLDQRKYASRLSEKARHIQDVLAGIAQKCGGDHTTDLARLLRLPGTLNRKDERNGREPIPTELVVCDRHRRYPLAVFEPLAIPAPETQRARQIAAMPLPKPRKLSPTKGDKLAQLIAASAIAPTGHRSGADYTVCRYAVSHGVDREEVWSLAGTVGKFAERGRSYFDLTWENACYDSQVAMFEKVQRQTGGHQRPPADAPPGQADGASPPDDEPPDDAGGTPGASGPSGQPTIYVDTASMPVGLTMKQITDRLLQVGGCYNRTGQLVVVRQEEIQPVLSAAELSGLLNQHVEFYFVEDESGEYKPLPASYGNTWLNHAGEYQRLPAIKLFTRNPVYADDWRLVSTGYDPGSGIYYAGPEVEPREGTACLDALLQDFCFRTRGDRTNYLAMLLTTLLIPRFIGSKPAVLFNGNQPELGKSILAQTIAILRDGQPVETASYNPNDEEFEKRLGSIVRRGATTIIIDNAKGRGRNPRIESACLERSITDPILSYRLLGFSEDIRAENSHIFCLTANSPDVSRDLVTRSVVVNLYYEGNPERRQFTIADPEGYAQAHRLDLLGELIGMVERWKAAGRPEVEVHSRFNKRGWGRIVGGILHTCGQPDFLTNAEEVATLLDDTRREFSELVGVLADHPQGVWTAAELSEQCDNHKLLQEELGERSARSRATRLGVIAARYVAERFDLSGGRTAVFHRGEDRNGKLYRVEIVEKVRNVE